MLASELIASIKIAGSIPENQDQFSSEVILSIATDFLQKTIAPALMKANEEFFVFEHEAPILAGKRIRIPSRAIAGTLRDVQIKRGSSLASLPLLNREDASTSSPGRPDSFYLAGNSIVLYPTPASSEDSLLLPFCIRPSRLVLETEAAQIIDIAGATLTVNSVPSTFLPGKKVDLIKGTSGYECVAIELSIISILGNSITFAALPDLEEGDWVALTGFSPIPCIPDEFQPILSDMAAAKCLASLGFFDQSQAIQGRADAELATQCALITPRVIGEPQRITSVLF